MVHLWSNAKKGLQNIILSLQNRKLDATAIVKTPANSQLSKASEIKNNELLSLCIQLFWRRIKCCFRNKWRWRHIESIIEMCVLCGLESAAPLSCKILAILFSACLKQHHRKSQWAVNKEEELKLQAALKGLSHAWPIGSQQPLLTPAHPF